MKANLICGDVRDVLPTLADCSVHCAVTSPPYFGLRDYQVDGQIGLESSPETYVDELVNIFREVRRVLRDDGTFWLNLGDSYARQGGDNSKRDPSKLMGGQADCVAAGNYAGGNGKIPSGCKTKDLMGIPWSVAKALRAPYYTGTIKDERDRIWLAAMLDAEGCMFIHKRKTGQSNGRGYVRVNDSYGPGVEIANTSRAVVERILSLTGRGSICSQGPEENHRRKQRIYRWNLRTVECREFVRELYPYLVAKQHQARILCGCPSSGERAEAAHRALMLLHNGGHTDVDFAAPGGLYEPGWYLRSDIIWAKPAPMPESVTDRPTRSHEYLFLLTKSPRYYYDAHAIREPHTSMAHPPGNKSRVIEGRLGEDSGWNLRPSAVKAFPAGGRNKRDVWTLTTRPYKGAHFATFPPALVEPCILAGTSEGGCCRVCGAPYTRIIEKGAPLEEQKTACGADSNGEYNGVAQKDYASAKAQNASATKARILAGMVEKITVGWNPSCACDAGDPIPCTVLDPFGGAMTTGLVALQHGRDFVGVELNTEYLRLGITRLAAYLETK